MNTFKPIISLIITLAFAVLPAVAQQPVRWRSFVKVQPDGTGELTIKALVEPGWHLYGLNLPKGGPKPTTFDLSESTGVKFTGKLTPKREPLTVKDELFGMALQWWDSNIEFVVPFKTEADDATYKCKINYMTCDGSTCQPPTVHTLTGKIKTADK